jgi:hypothetical protein
MAKLNLSRRFGHLRCFPGQSIAINTHRTQTANSVFRYPLDNLSNAGFTMPLAIKTEDIKNVAAEIYPAP